MTRIAWSGFGRVLGLRAIAERQAIARQEEFLARQTPDEKAARLRAQLVHPRASVDARVEAAGELAEMGRADMVDAMISVFRDGWDGVVLKDALKAAINRFDATAFDTWWSKYYGLGEIDRDMVEKVRRVMQPDTLDRDGALADAVAHVKQAGGQASDTLAHVIERLIYDRSRGVVAALHVAQAATSTPALSATLRSIEFTPPYREGTLPSGQDPELIGGGRLAWSDETYRQIRELAAAALP